MIFLLATLWNSLVAWVLIGIIWLVFGLLGHWAFEPRLLVLWPMVLLIGYVALWRDSNE